MAGGHRAVDPSRTSAQRPVGPRRAARRFRLFGPLLGLLVGIGVLAVMPQTVATLTGGTGNGPNSWSAATVQPPSALTATQNCSAGSAGVDLSWTTTASTFATGYHLSRDGGAPQTITPYTTTFAHDSGPLSTGTHTWTLSAFIGLWDSPTASLTTSISGCPAIVVPNSFYGGAAATNANLTITVPSAIQANDVMLVQIARDHSDNNVGKMTPPPCGCWTLAVETGDKNSNGAYSSIWWKVATSTDPGTSYSWVAGGGGKGTAAIIAYRGVNTTAPIDVVSGAWGNGTSLTAPSVTTTFANDVLVHFATEWDSKTSITLPSGMTQEYNYLPASSPDIRIGAADQTLANPGATGTRTTTASASHNWDAQLVALRP